MSLRYHPSVRVFRSFAHVLANAVHWCLMAQRTEQLRNLVWQGGLLLALLVMAAGVAWLVNFSAWLILFFIGVLLLLFAGGARSKVFTVGGGVFLALGIGSLFEVSFGLPGMLFAALGTTLVLSAEVLSGARTWLMALGLAVLTLGIILYLHSLGTVGYVIGAAIVYVGLASAFGRLGEVRTSRPHQA